MKKYIFIVLLLCTLTTVYSQTVTYTPIPLRNTVWVDKLSSMTNYYQLLQTKNSDTIISGKTYSQIEEVIHNEPYLGGIRNDTAGRKVYFIEKGKTKEYLMYDFSLSVGDTAKSVFVLNGSISDTANYVVTNLTAIWDGTKFRKGIVGRYFKGTFVSYRTVVWIEGIGSQTGLLPYPYLFVCPDQDLICFQTDTALYNEDFYHADTLKKTTSLSTCADYLAFYTLSMEEVTAQKDGIVIFPNPSYNHSAVVAIPDAKDVQSIIVTDVQGRILQQQNYYSQPSIHLDLNNLNSGMYIVQIQQKNKVISKKLIVQD